MFHTIITEPSSTEKQTTPRRTVYYSITFCRKSELCAMPGIFPCIPQRICLLSALTTIRLPGTKDCILASTVDSLALSSTVCCAKYIESPAGSKKGDHSLECHRSHPYCVAGSHAATVALAKAVGKSSSRTLPGYESSVRGNKLLCELLVLWLYQN